MKKNLFPAFIIFALFFSTVQIVNLLNFDDGTDVFFGGGYSNPRIVSTVTDPSFNDSITVLGTTTSSLTMYLDKENPDPFDGGVVYFDAKNASSTQTHYAALQGIVVDPTTGQEIGALVFKGAQGGTLNDMMVVYYDGSEIVFGSSIAGAPMTFSTDSNGDIRLAPNGTGLPILNNAPAFPTQQSVGSANEAVDTTSYTTIVATDADGTTHSLADGTVTGTLKVVAIGSDGGGNAVITPTSFANGTSITCDDAGDLVELYWTGSAWFRRINEGCTINP